jgi:hypothetical protein
MDTSTSVEKQNISFIVDGLNNLLMGSHGRQADIEDLRRQIRIIDAKRLEEASRSDDLAEFCFKRACGAAVYLNLGEDSKTAGEEIRKKIVDIFKEEQLEILVEDGPHSGSFYWRVFTRSKRASNRKDHKHKIEKIGEKVENAVKSSLKGLKGGMCCLVVVSGIGLMWHDYGPSHQPEKPATGVVKTAPAMPQVSKNPEDHPAPEPHRYDGTKLLAAWGFVKGVKEAAELADKVIDMIEKDEKKK